ncbi:uncharacterized protein LOC118183435 isoform X2 [Stegodyphus dumicola]|uniref:uncharacterized protein LOC118183435 isoform X2 n=1 Tax=Stegodyphus dumicola TaxID=202533 RepID=UPI0015AF42A8|nr:uncharacterized protein LOC118183435 isoform X2 [Stegodyphus dumicola]
MSAETSFSITVAGISATKLKYSSMRPRTFYLSPNQEFQVISQVLCEGMPCPEFSVVQDHPNFIQQRSYRSSKFLKLTAPRLCSLKSVLEDGIDRAEKYIKGANNREQMYVHTQPLLIEVDQHTSSKSKNPWCRMSYSANLFIPHFWGIIATPTKILAEFQEIPENSQIYVHTFEGNIEKVLLTEIELFRRNLDSLRLCYKKMKFYVAIYDIPHSPSDSRNELWFLKCSGR